MNEDQIEKLIELVRVRPGLYDRRLKAYTDRNANRRLWKEVCQEFLDTWDKMSSQEKLIKAKEVQQRWQNLRTCFKREINKSRSGDVSKKRRKYIFYNQLAFLLPCEMISSPTESKLDGKQKDEAIPSTQTEQTMSNKLKPKLIQLQERATFQGRPAVQERPLFKENQTRDDIDEDKSFLLSLVPAFRRMTQDQKFEAKIEFLSILKRIALSKACLDGSEGNHYLEDLPETSHQYFTQANDQTVLDSPTQSDISHESFASSICKNPTPSDYIEVNEIKTE